MHLANAVHNSEAIFRRFPNQKLRPTNLEVQESNFLVRSDSGIKVKQTLQLGFTDGGYNDNGIVIDHIDGATSAVITGASDRVNVSRGMQHRVEYTLQLAEVGVPSLTTNGNCGGM